MLLLVAASALLALGVEDEGGLPAVDPYTSGEPARIERAGYVAYAPFSLVRGQPTFVVDETVGQELIWIETPHFRLGSSLESYRMPGDKRERTQVRAELKRLATKFDDVPTRPRELDPWLRAHLYAQRLEDLYQSFCERFGVRGEDVRLLDETQRLTNPYLGQREKFVVLLCQKQSTLARYGERFLSGAPKGPMRHYFLDGAFFFGTSMEALGGHELDAALHVALAFGVTGNFVDAFRSFRHETPLWLVDGVGHWFSRAIDERWCVYASYRPRDDDHWKWPVRMRKRVAQEYFPSANEMFAWTSEDTIDLGRQLVLWSRVDYLFDQHEEVFPALLWKLKGPLPREGVKGETEALVALQVDALDAFLGVTPEEFDARWARWVEKSYPRR